MARLKSIGDVSFMIGKVADQADWERVKHWLSRNEPESAPDIIYRPGADRTPEALILHVSPSYDEAAAIQHAWATLKRALDARQEEVDMSKVQAVPFLRGAGRV